MYLYECRILRSGCRFDKLRVLTVGILNASAGFVPEISGSDGNSTKKNASGQMQPTLNVITFRTRAPTPKCKYNASQFHGVCIDCECTLQRGTTS
ncbi:hypothetical protein PILCRDRAFT_811921 [Piloderma croceum F 1598]|uniref:Uncharacterized protein n=1 Tax=Piloderma croceum (strain F 1598) TaxID=765440 RepID=A0A0C3BUJ4_PILCF|nr:hypothetical protein PILCRDRAFT_811921 [Piloderma croceum F 1598]